jgi:hypothetical protein
MLSGSVRRCSGKVRRRIVTVPVFFWAAPAASITPTRHAALRGAASMSTPTTAAQLSP